MGHQTNDDGIIQVGSDEVPVYNKSSLPQDAQIIILTEEQNFDYGGLLSVAYRLDLDRIIPSSARHNVWYSINSPDANISVPLGAVVPAFVESFSPYGLQRAQATIGGSSRAQFLIVSLDQNIDDNYVIQSSGFFTFDEPHNYDIGQTYYLSDSSAGAVTNTPPPGVVQPLFVPVDPVTIRILIGE